jgi:glycosyltransferase involved in cell wall biosynthesis
VVASRVGGLPEIIEDGVTGFACPPEDVDGMAERGLALLTDPALRATVARHAVEMVRTRYCTERIVPMYEAAYLSVLGGAVTDISGGPAAT